MEGILLILFAVVFTEAKYCEFPCERMAKPVCGHDGKTYQNYCILRQAACEKGEAIINVFPRPCPKDSNACDFPCPRMNLPVCGSNHEMFPNECELRRGACKEKKAIIEVRWAKSRDDDCSSCEIECTEGQKPICGSDYRTYDNECKMKKEACKRKQAIIKVYDGKCE